VALKAPRRPAAAVPSITGLRISPSGNHATLVDISESGLLAECSVALEAGQKISVLFEGTFLPSSVRARVARSCVAAMTSAGCRYHLGIAFDTRIAFNDELSWGRTAGDAPATIVLDGASQLCPVFNRW
jgi:hypothetical protein